MHAISPRNQQQQQQQQVAIVMALKATQPPPQRLIQRIRQVAPMCTTESLGLKTLHPNGILTTLTIFVGLAH